MLVAIKNQQFGCTIKPFLSDKSACLKDKIIIKDDEKIINNDKHICEFFNKYFVNVAEGSG